MGNEALDDIEAQLARGYAADPEIADLGKPSVRKAQEKKHRRNPNDGRSNRATGRTEQFNIKVKAGLKERMIKAGKVETALRRHHVPVAMIIEELCEAYLKSLAKKQGAVS